MKNIRFCSKSILLWRAIKGDGSRIFIRCPTRLDSTAYKAVLEEGIQNIYADGSVFIRDGAQCHTSRSIMLNLEKQKICLLNDLPQQSPDIDVTKNTWSILKTCAFKFNITSSDDLWNATLKAWNDIPIETIYNLRVNPSSIKSNCECQGTSF